MASPKRFRLDRPKAKDTDKDGVSDDFERNVLGTNPNKRDTDGDGIGDGEERTYGTDPRHRDTDRDGLSDAREVAVGSDPTRKDTDADGVGDATEVRKGTHRVVDDNGDREPDWRLDAKLPEDTDGDGLTNTEETWLGTNRWKKDTDDDGWGDQWEVKNLRKPRPDVGEEELQLDEEPPLRPGEDRIELEPETISSLALPELPDLTPPIEDWSSDDTSFADVPPAVTLDPRDEPIDLPGDAYA